MKRWKLIWATTKKRGAYLFRRQLSPDAKERRTNKQRIIIDKVEANVPVDDAIFHFPGQISLPQPQR